MSVSADVWRKPGVVVVGERSSRSEHVGLRDVGRKPRQVMEWNEGIEPSPSGWKPGALPVELIPRGVVQSSKDSDRPVTRILRRSTPVAGARVELALRTGYEPGAAPLLRVPRGWLGERSSGSEHVGLRRCRPEMSTSSWLGERSSRSEHVGLVECRPEVSTSSCAIDGTRTHILLLDRELLQPIELRRQEVFGRKSRRLGE